MFKNKPGKLLMICTITILSCSMLFSNVSFADTWVFDQTITAYVSAPGAKCASGITPYKGAAAQHPVTRNDHSSEPLFGFGAYCVLAYEVPMYGGGTRSTFFVEDIGDVDYAAYDAGNVTLWWLDIWQGTYYTAKKEDSDIYKWCKNTFGTKYRNYTAYH